MRIPELARRACASLLGVTVCAIALAFEPAAPAGPESTPPIATFSIVARDPQTGDYGVAVQSRYFAVGAVVPHAAADTGAIATQARGNPVHGWDGLALLEAGLGAEEVIQRLLSEDALSDERQLGVVDRAGNAASYTGAKCLHWAGGRTGTNYAVQGNLLAGPQVVDAIATAFEFAQGDFATRLVFALQAGQAAGGDARGRQSAALLVVRQGGGYLGLDDHYIDLHVEDHPTPIRELERLLRIRQGQLLSVQANAALVQAERAGAEGRAALLAQARLLLVEALEKNPSDDYGWWTLARVHLLEGEQQAAARAAERALLLNPSWRHLSAANRSSLGVSAELLEGLLQIESFNRVWTSLAPVGTP